MLQGIWKQEWVVRRLMVAVRNQCRAIILVSIILMEGGKPNLDMDTSQSCTGNTFLLKRLNVPTHAPSVQVDFSPLLPPNSPHSRSLHPQPSFPVFNSDHCFFTPAFVLDFDKEKYVANGAAYEAMHQCKVQELSVEKEQMFVPRPSRSNSFCCICKLQFEDYLTHVNMPRHQQLMHASEFAQSITQLCQRYQQKDVETVRSAHGRKGRKIVKNPKANSKKRGGKGTVREGTCNLEFAASVRQQIEV